MIDTDTENRDGGGGGASPANDALTAERLKSTSHQSPMPRHARLTAANITRMAINRLRETLSGRGGVVGMTSTSRNPAAMKNEKNARTPPKITKQRRAQLVRSSRPTALARPQTPNPQQTDAMIVSAASEPAGCVAGSGAARIATAPSTMSRPRRTDTTLPAMATIADAMIPERLIVELLRGRLRGDCI